MDVNQQNLYDALQTIPPAELYYDEWLGIGMALQYEGLTQDVWEEWSRQDSERYHHEDFAQKWASFSSGKTNTKKGGFIVMLAKRYGFKPTAMQPAQTVRYAKTATVPSWQDRNMTDYNRFVNLRPEIAALSVDIPTDTNKVQDLLRFFDTLFLQDTVIAVCIRSTDDGKPEGAGYVHDVAYYYQQLRQALYDAQKQREQIRNDNTIADDDKHSQLAKLDDDIIQSAFGSYNKDNGTWICINPINKQGRKDSNVTDYKYALIECDELSLDEQYSFFIGLHLPIATLVYSGGKSLHAIVRINAGKDKALYSKRVQFLYDFCSNNGFPVDISNKNASRLSRLPSFRRGKHWQQLIATNIGPVDFEAWTAYLRQVKIAPLLALSGTFNQDLIDNPPPLTPELIEGVLRQGHKLMITGKAKIGKTFLLIELAHCLAGGFKWWDKYPCKQSRVVYVNIEIDGKTFENRIREVYLAMPDMPQPPPLNFKYFNLRGAVPNDFDDLTDAILTDHPEVIIIDPVYKIFPGDENKTQDATEFVKKLDVLVTQTGASVIYSHHHTKGAQSGKDAIDRGAGSSVTARDADALIDLSEDEFAGTKLDPYREKLQDAYELTDEQAATMRAFVVSTTFREFADSPTFVVLRVGIRFFVDTKHILSTGESPKPLSKRQQAVQRLTTLAQTTSKKQRLLQNLQNAFNQHKIDTPRGTCVRVSVLCDNSKELFGESVERNTLKKRLQQFPEVFDLTRERGMVYLVDKNTEII